MLAGADLITIVANMNTLPAEALATGYKALGYGGDKRNIAGNWTLIADSALAKLRTCVPRDRKRVLNALLLTVLHDRTISQGESEMLRVFCMMMGVPVPPIVNQRSR